MAVHQIVKGGHLPGGNFLPDDVGGAGGQLFGHLGRGQVPAQPVIVADLPGGGLLLVQLVQPFFGAEAVVGLALLHQLLGVLLEHAHALALHIGADRAADVGAFVPGQAGGAQRVVNDVGGALHQTPLVGVLDAQDEGAALMAGLQPGIQCGAQVAHVHVARGGRRKPCANVFHVSKTPFYGISISVSFGGVKIFTPRYRGQGRRRRTPRRTVRRRPAAGR